MNPLLNFDVLWILMNDFVDRKSLLSCLLVCKLWNHCALAVLWSTRFLTMKHLKRLSLIYPRQPPSLILDRVKNVIFESSSFVKSDISLPWIRNCSFPRIKNLILKNYNSNLHAVTMAILQSVPSIQLDYLEVEWTDISMEDIEQVCLLVSRIKNRFFYI